MRRLLLLSASIISIAVAQGPAAAQDAMPPAGWYFSAEGGAAFGNFRVVDPPNLSTTNDLGFRGALSFGHRFDPAMDWRVNLAWTKFHDAVDDDTFTEMTSRFDYGTADLELGRTMATSDPLLAFRAFAGLRALYSKDSVDKVGLIDNNRHSNFVGVGPRAGFDFERRMADGPWGISGMAAGSAIFGSRNATDKTGTTTRSSETVLNVEGAVGVDYHTSATSKLTAGVRAEQWWNMHAAEDPDLEISPDTLSWGPFVKFEVKM